MTRRPFPLQAVIDALQVASVTADRSQSEAEQIRRGIALWLDSKGVTTKRPHAARKRGRTA